MPPCFLQFKFKKTKKQDNAPYLGGAQSCRVQSNRVPTYVLFLQVTLTTSMPVRQGRKEVIYFVLTMRIMEKK